MKRNLKRIISVVLIMSVLVSLAFTFNVHAADTPEYDSCADYYFSNFTGDNVPFNVVGSCGYVAMAMLLSYYDVYWNDNFVANGYERDATYNSNSNTFLSSVLKTENSILDDMHKAYKQAGGTLDILPYLQPLYLDFVTTHQNKGYLHLDLIGMGIDAGYYDGIFQNDEYSTTLNETAHLLDIYFDSIFGNYIYYDPLNLNSISGENPPIKIKIMNTTTIGVSYDDVVDKMYELVDEGVPVMYRGHDGTEGHRMIVYSTEKDSSGNIVDCNLHTGWRWGSQDTLSNTKYNSDIAILWLEIDESQIPHVCCDNFLVGTEKSCTCRVYGDLHPEHVHEPTQTCYLYSYDYHVVKCRWDKMGVTENHYIDRFSEITSTTHRAGCFCGYRYTTSHQYVYQDITDNKHTLACECGYSYEETHALTYEKESNDYHRATCVCGYILEENHCLEYQPSSNARHALVCVCGYKYTIPHQYTYQQLSNGQHLASCECGYTYEESHDFTHQQVSNDLHIAVCKCGYQYEEAHSLSYQRATENYHLMACICGYNYQVTHTLTYKDYHTDVCECGYERTTPHDYDYEQVSDTHHFVSCECGYEAEMWHTYTCRSISDSYHSQTCPCGHIGDPEAHAFERVDLRYSVCKDCGYRRDNLGPGGNVQMGVQEEEDTE